MQYQYPPDSSSGYSGYMWFVEASIYNENTREYEDGVFQEAIFDDEAEARESFFYMSNPELAQQALAGEDPYYDTMGVFLRQVRYEGGMNLDRGDYYHDMVVMENHYDRDGREK